MVKKLEFLHFCQILDVFGHFNQYNHEKSTKIKVILEICAAKFGKSTNTPRGNSFCEHHSGSNAKILSKKSQKFSFSQYSSLEICQIPIKIIQNKLVYYMDEMNQVKVPVDYICVHPGGANSSILTKNDTRYFVV